MNCFWSVWKSCTLEEHRGRPRWWGQLWELEGPWFWHSIRVQGYIYGQLTWTLWNMWPQRMCLPIKFGALLWQLALACPIHFGWLYRFSNSASSNWFLEAYRQKETTIVKLVRNYRTKKYSLLSWYKLIILWTGAIG